MTNYGIKCLDYLKGIGCVIEYGTMERTIKEFDYKNTQQVMAIDGHVISIEAFNDFAEKWCKIIKPRLTQFKGCENCRNAIYDSVPYGMGNTEMLSGCKFEDEVTEEEMANNIECHKFENY